MLDSLSGRVVGRARVEYVEIRRCNANDIFELERIVEMVENKFNPPDSSEVVMVAMVGDQPIFRMLFQLWLSSYVKKTKRCHWMVPLPGQFHIDKQGLIPTVKRYLAGAGLEELLRFSGLSEKHQINFMTLPHYRKNRRILSQITAALIIRLNKALCELDPDLAKEISALIEEVEKYNELTRDEKLQIARRDAFVPRISEIMPTGCQLGLSNVLHPSMIRIGKLLSDATIRLSERSPNMKFFGEIQVLSVLVPWSAYNLLIRKGQTEIVDKFYDAFVGLLHGTIKLNYQENLLYYNFVRKVMSPVAKHIIFREGHLVASQNETTNDTHLALDESMEAGMIRDTKLWQTNNAIMLQNSPPFTTVLRKVLHSTENELRVSMRKEVLNSDTGEVGDVYLHGHESSGLNASTYAQVKKHDRERKTALNIVEMVEFLDRRCYFVEEHLRSSYVVNPLPEPQRIIRAPGFVEQLINADEQGRFAASLHLGAKLHEVFVHFPLTDDDRVNFFDNKPFHLILNHWNRKWLFKSISQADPSSSIESVIARKNKEATRRLVRSMDRRRERVESVKHCLLDLYFECSLAGGTHGRRVEDLRKLHEEANRNGHVLTPKAFVFRKNVISNEAHYCLSHRFFDALQGLDVVQTSGTQFVKDSSIIPENVARTIAALHIDATSSVSHSPSAGVVNLAMREVVSDKARAFVEPFVLSQQYCRVVDIHYHLDVSSEAPVGFNSVRYTKKSTTLGGSGDNEAEGATATGEEIFLSMSSVYDRPWQTILQCDQNRAFLSGLYVVECARMSVLLKDSHGKEQTYGGSNSRSSESGYTAFIHGVAIAMEGRGRAATISDLQFERHARTSSVLVTRRSEAAAALLLNSYGAAELNRHSNNQVNAAGGPSSLQEELVFYDASCCWALTNRGMRRYPAGDAEHALSLTRIPFVVANVTIERLGNLKKDAQAAIFNSDASSDEIQPTCGDTTVIGSSDVAEGEAEHSSTIQDGFQSDFTVSVRNSQTELPLLIILSGINNLIRVLCTSEERCVDVRLLDDALRAADLDIRDIAMLFSLSGCDHTPHAKGIDHGLFLQSYLELKNSGAINVGQLYTPHVIAEIVDSSLQQASWIDSEKVIAGAFLKSFIRKHRRGSSLSLNRAGSTATKNTSSSCVVPEGISKRDGTWSHAVRVLISKQMSEHPELYLPECSDLELQYRRGVLWNFIWNQCSNFRPVCLPEGARPHDFGYDDRGHVWFENQEESKRRETLLRDPVVRTCKCRSKSTACSTRQCGCVARSISCILCECSSSCVNTGIKASDSTTNETHSTEENESKFGLDGVMQDVQERSTGQLQESAEISLENQSFPTSIPDDLSPSQEEIASLDQIQISRRQHI